MLLKKTGDRKDGVTWRCRRIHKYESNGKKYVCKDVKISIRHNSWIQDSNLSLGLILELIYLWIFGLTVDQLIHETRLSKKTLIEWTTYFRDICQYFIMKESTAIGGEGIHVEIDESKFGKRKYYRGRRVDGQWIFGGRETKDKSKVFMVPVKNRKARTLLPIIIRWIKPGSIVHSDCWKAYSRLKSLGYEHITVNHSKNFVDPESNACTNHIECDWRHAKASLPKYGVHKGLHASYLAEFMWRRRFHDYDKFSLLLEQVSTAFNEGHFTCINS